MSDECSFCRPDCCHPQCTDISCTTHLPLPPRYPFSVAIPFKQITLPKLCPDYKPPTCPNPPTCPPAHPAKELPTCCKPVKCPEPYCRKEEIAPKHAESNASKAESVKSGASGDKKSESNKAPSEKSHNEEAPKETHEEKTPEIKKPPEKKIRTIPAPTCLPAFCPPIPPLRCPPTPPGTLPDPPIDMSAKEVVSGDATWWTYGIRILFTNPSLPELKYPQPLWEKRLTVCIQMKNNVDFHLDWVKVLCKTNIVTEDNPCGHDIEIPMCRVPSLSQYECFTQSHMYQLILYPICCQNKDIQFKVRIFRLTIWAPETDPTIGNKMNVDISRLSADPTNNCKDEQSDQKE